LGKTIQEITDEKFSASNGARSGRKDVGKFLVLVTDRYSEAEITTATANVRSLHLIALIFVTLGESSGQNNSIIDDALN